MNIPLRLRTPRMELIAADAVLARADASDRPALARLLSAEIPAAWPPPLTADHIEQFAGFFESGAWTPGLGPWYWILDDGGPRTLIGNGGFGPPDVGGRLVMGYAVLDEFQRRGLATEAVAALLNWAFAHQQTPEVVGDTFLELVGSIKVMRANRMVYTGPGPESRTIRFRITGAEHAAAAPSDTLRP